jgi:hypothetical protein
LAAEVKMPMRHGPGVVSLAWWVAALVGSVGCTGSERTLVRTSKTTAQPAAPDPAAPERPAAPDPVAAVPVPAPAPVAAPAAPPWYELAPTPIDERRIAAPPMLAYIPADSPFALVSFEPVSLDYFAKLKRELGPRLAPVRDRIRELAKAQAKARSLEAFAAELDGKWTADGLATLGLAPTSRFAIYGLGPLVVARIEVKDPRALLAAMDRMARRGGDPLPPPQVRGDRTLWRTQGADGRGDILAFGGGELVLAAGPARAIDGALPLILGEQRPPASLASGMVLEELMARHRLGPTLVGFASTAWLADRLVAQAGPAPAACTAAIARLAAWAPRLAFGLDGLPGDRMTGGVVLELAPTLVDELRRMKTRSPRLGAALEGEEPFVMGVAIAHRSWRRVSDAVAPVLAQLGATCGSADLALAAGGLQSAQLSQLPAGAEQINGAVLAVDSFAELAAARMSGGPPTKLDAFLLLTAPDPRAVARELFDAAPVLRGHTPPLDGRLHPLGLASPYEIHAGARSDGFVIAAGEIATRHARRALAGAARPAAPLLAVSLDLAKLFAVMGPQGRALLDGDGGGELPLDAEQLGERMGRAVASFLFVGHWDLTIDPTSHGLAVRFAQNRR